MRGIRLVRIAARRARSIASRSVGHDGLPLPIEPVGHVMGDHADAAVFVLARVQLGVIAALGPPLLGAQACDIVAELNNSTLELSGQLVGSSQS